MRSGLPITSASPICKPTNQDLPVILQLRELSRFRFRLERTDWGRQTQAPDDLDGVFPEYEHLFSNVFLETSRIILKEAVSAQEFADFDLQNSLLLLAQASHGRFGQQKAEIIQQQARQSVGVSFLANAAPSKMKCLLAQINLLEDQRSQADQIIAELMQQIPQHITSIPGIGPATGAAILAEIGDIQRFETVV